MARGRVLERDGSDDGPTARMYSPPPNCILKNGEDGKLDAMVDVTTIKIKRDAVSHVPFPPHKNPLNEHLSSPKTMSLSLCSE